MRYDQSHLLLRSAGMSTFARCKSTKQLPWEAVRGILNSQQPFTRYKLLLPLATCTASPHCVWMRQITHALGFSSSKFAYYRDHSNGGQPRTARCLPQIRPADSAQNSRCRNNYGWPGLGSISPWGTTIYQPDTNTMTSVTERGQTVYKIVTPKALEKAKEQFGCSTLSGVELENQGGTGTAGDHWEKRIYMNDFMTGMTAATEKRPC